MDLDAATEGQEGLQSNVTSYLDAFPVSKRFCIPVASIKLSQPTRLPELHWEEGQQCSSEEQREKLL